MRRMAQWEIIGGHAQWELVDACTAERKVPLEKTYLGPIIQWDWQPPCDPMDVYMACWGLGLAALWPLCSSQPGAR